ncbi:MAG: hypothetical protein K2W96_19530 [Gemmataceae bacterium]|nr:hypothetical protein [Gemmataceae bacterium]
MPASIREWIAFWHDANDRGCEFLRDDFGMGVVPGLPVLSLLEQAEGDYHWGVRRGDLDAEDPPVLGYCLNDLDHEPPEWEADVGRWESSSGAWLALDYAVGYSSSGGQTLKSHEVAVARLAESLPVHARLGMSCYFEADHLLARVMIGDGWSSLDLLGTVPGPLRTLLRSC